MGHPGSVAIRRIFALSACVVPLAAAAILSASPADAQRPDLRSMSCAQAQGLIASRGAVVMSTGQFTFDRFVANASFCTREEVTRRAYTPTGDNPRCALGLRCEPRMRRFSRD